MFLWIIIWYNVYINELLFNLIFLNYHFTSSLLHLIVIIQKNTWYKSYSTEKYCPRNLIRTIKIHDLYCYKFWLAKFYFLWQYFLAKWSFRNMKIRWNGNTSRGFWFTRLEKKTPTSNHQTNMLIKPKYNFRSSLDLLQYEKISTWSGKR